MESMLENFYDLLCQVVFFPLFGSIIVDLFLGFSPERFVCRSIQGSLGEMEGL